MKLIPIFFCLIIGIVFCNCKKDSIPTYTGGDYIYIDGLNYSQYIASNSSIKNYTSDTFRFNFSYLDVQDTLFVLSINTIGTIKDYNRAFDLSITPVNAIDSKDYIMVNKDSIFIPSDSNKIYLRIKVFKNDDYLDSSFTLDFKLNSNENFKATMLPNFGLTNDSSYYIHKILKISNTIDEPTLWENNLDVLGSFSSKKIKLFVSTIKLSWSRFYATLGGYSSIELTNNARSFQDSLNVWKNNNNTILEKNGSTMVMGPSVQ